MTPSPYGPYELGYTRVTMGKTKRNAERSQALTFPNVRIECCNLQS